MHYTHAVEDNISPETETGGLIAMTVHLLFIKYLCYSFVTRDSKPVLRRSHLPQLKFFGDNIIPYASLTIQCAHIENEDVV